MHIISTTLERTRGFSAIVALYKFILYCIVTKLLQLDFHKKIAKCPSFGLISLTAKFEPDPVHCGHKVGWVDYEQRCDSLTQWLSDEIRYSIEYPFSVHSVRRMSNPLATHQSAVCSSSRKVLVLEDPYGLICESLSLSSDFKLLENFRGLHAFLKQFLCENFQRKVVLELFPYLTVYRCWR